MNCFLDPVLLTSSIFSILQALLAIKIAAVAMSGSISLISSLVDSAVDLVSGIVIWITTRAVKRTDRYVYPQGKLHFTKLVCIDNKASWTSCRF